MARLVALALRVGGAQTASAACGSTGRRSRRSSASTPTRSASYWRLWTVCTADRLKRRVSGLVSPREPDAGPEIADRCTIALRRLYGDASPVPFPSGLSNPSSVHRIPGTGVYLRTDYWVQLTSGGSYGHTCYVARELAALTEQFTCLMASHFPMLDEFGLRQVVMPPASDSAGEIPLLAATWHYYPILKVAFGMNRPAYIYERLCLGNFAAALVSLELGIPYILEYNGSEISMSRSFNGTSLEYETLFVRAEEAAFRQATVITVVSEVLKDSLVARKVDPRKILVNPNGADPDRYAPPAEASGARCDPSSGSPTAIGSSASPARSAAGTASTCSRRRFRRSARGRRRRSSCSSATARTSRCSTRRWPRTICRIACAAPDACPRPKAPGCSAPATSSCRRTTATWWTASSSARPPSCSSTWRWAAASSAAISSSSARCCRRRCASATSRSPDLRVGPERAVLCTPGDVDEFVAAVVALVDRPGRGRSARPQRAPGGARLLLLDASRRACLALHRRAGVRDGGA